MAKPSPVPAFVRLANTLVATLLRAGLKLSGPGGTPMYLLTVRGRKSGQPRTTPIAILERDGKRLLAAPYGVVDWVRNLRAAGAATLTRGGRTEEIHAIELSIAEATPILQDFIQSGNPIGRFFGIAPDASPEEFEQMAATHPVFMLESAVAPSIHGSTKGRAPSGIV
jgi:deazaflavin-dependent oxidoreductase (nitroreductase family)